MNTENRYDWQRAWELTYNRSAYASIVEHGIDDDVDRFLVENWHEYFSTDPALLKSGDYNGWEGSLHPSLSITSDEELRERLSSDFDKWFRGEKARLNLTVGADIPLLLAALAGSERRLGEYVTQLIREVHKGKQEIEPNIQALRLEIMGLDGRLRTLERQVEELSRR